MGSGARATLAAAFGIWAGVAGAGEPIWEGAVRVVDAKTLAGVPDGPVLPLGGIEPPPPDARCGPATERPACREIAVQALKDAVAGQHLVCERRPPARSVGDSATRDRGRPGKRRGWDREAIACRAGDLDVADIIDLYRTLSPEDPDRGYALLYSERLRGPARRLMPDHIRVHLRARSAADGPFRAADEDL